MRYRRSRSSLVAGSLVLCAVIGGAAPVSWAQPPLRIADGLTVTAVSEPPAGSTVRVAQPFGRKGPTSLRYFPSTTARRARPSPNPADPAGSQYLIKDRDLGQTFSTPAGEPFRLDAITVRVGPAPLDDLAGIAGARRATVFLQIFEVTGTPVIHDNGTTGRTTVSVSYPGQARADDYITGERYRTLVVARGGELPDALAVGESNTAVPTRESRGTLLRFELRQADRPVLQPGRQYAFMVGFEHAAERRALPLDNYDYLNQPDASEQDTQAGPYRDGHAIRREGSVEAPHDHLDKALSLDGTHSSFPAAFERRLQQQPGTWGRPDVDTYRDLVFWIEGAAAEGPVTPRVTLSLVAEPPSGSTVVASYDGFDSSGNTSIAHDSANSFKWSGASPYAHGDWGYFTPTGQEVAYIKRDRDLGQTFVYTGRAPARLTAVTVRTGFGTNVVRRHAFGRSLSIQIFRVTGAPTVHDNGTGGSVRALHGFPHDRMGEHIPAERDDYIVGDTYESMAVLRGATFPSKTDFGLDAGADVDPDDRALKGRYLRFDLSQSGGVVVTPGATYAFLIMLDEAGEDRGFTLANHYVGSFAGGHGIRRDGDGTFPPAAADPSKPFTHPTNARALASAHFPGSFDARTRIAPGTNGYPDVDTWRDLCFWVEAKPIAR